METKTDSKELFQSVQFKLIKDVTINLKESIKSKYIIKEIFSYLGENKSLYIIKYNKEYKDILGINMDKYKKISGKIKIGEKS